jgi:hypothetical protein
MIMIKRSNREDPIKHAREGQKFQGYVSMHV